jgi:phytoene/squalene synthetase
MLALHQVNAPEARTASDQICTGLQLANFWQDLSIDLSRGRCYLPNEWLQKVDSNSEMLLAAETSAEELRPALDEAIHFTQNLLNNGQALLPHLPFRLKLQISATLHGGRRILDKVADLDNPLSQRPRLSRGDWLGMSMGILRDALLPSSAPQPEST